MIIVKLIFGFFFLVGLVIAITPLLVTGIVVIIPLLVAGIMVIIPLLVAGMLLGIPLMAFVILGIPFFILGRSMAKRKALIDTLDDVEYV